jgi:hypothetical protein
VRAWLWEHEIYLGNSEELATNWLLVYQAEQLGLMAPLATAARRIQQQRQKRLGLVG